MKKLLFIFFVLTSFLSKAQQIIYTPQTAAGYQFKYGKFDSGFNLPYKDRSLGRGITRGGAVIFDSTGKHFYGWNETNWVLLDEGGISNVTIIDSSHIQICNLNGCDTLTTSVTAQLVTILSDTSLMVCDTLFACDTFYVSPTQFVQNIFDTTSIYNAIYDIRNFLGDTSFTNQFMPNLGVVTDTIVKIDSTITRYVFTDGTYKEDTSKVYFTQDNITAITNILNYIDSVNGFDTTFIRNYQLLDGEEIVTVSTDSLTRNDTLNFDYNVEGKAGRVLSNDGTNLQWVLTSDHHQNGLVYGGVVTWLHDYVYNISAAGYYIDDVFYESPSTDVTLDPADATNDRIDLFALTTSSIAIDITGTPAGTPVEPDYDANTQLKISFAIVYANTTEPPAPGVEWIYKENVEWATTASGPTINPASTNNPFAGTLDVEGTNVGNAAYINFVSPSPVDWTKYNYLTFQIRSKGNFQNSKKIVFRFMSSINNAVGNNVPVGSGSYGFISTQTASYQTISIPLSDFGSIGTADRLRITESNTSGTAGWYLDNIQLQYIPQTTPNVSVVFYGKNATRDSTVLLLSNGTRFAAFDSSATDGSVADGSETIVTAGTNVTVTGTGTSGNPYVVNSTAGGGSTVNNAGSGYRLVTTDGTEIKTVFPGINTLIDSSTNTNGLTIHADTTDGNLHLATQGDIANALLTGGSSGGENLQQTTDIGNTTTKVMYSTDSIKSYSKYTTGGAMFADSSALLPADSIVFYGASIEAGTSGTGVNGANVWTQLVSNNLGAVRIDNAIGSTGFRSDGGAHPNAFMDRIATWPTYRATERYIVIGGSNILNDMSFHFGPAGLTSEVERAIDTLHLNRGWPLNRIVLALPSLCGTYTSEASQCSNDSLKFYVEAAKSAAITKGIPYVDNHTYTMNNGGVTLLSSDSIHPNVAGHYQMSEGFTYRISDVKVNNSLRVNRDFLVKDDASIGDKLTMVNTTSGTTGNFEGILNWGTAGGGNGLTFYDGGTTALKSGIGYNLTGGYTSIFGKTPSGGIMFGLGQDATTLTTTNAHMFMSNSVTAGVVLAGAATTFNGDVSTHNLRPNVIIPVTPAASGSNIQGLLNWGNTGAVLHGFYTLDANSTSLRAGMTYDVASTGKSFLFGRGSLDFLIGTGVDNTNMTRANSSAYINTVGRFNFNGLSTAYIAKTSTYTAVAADHTINCTSGTFTVTLPSAAGTDVQGRQYVIVNSGSGTITIGTTSSQTFVNINTAPTTLTLGPVGAGAITSYTVVSNGANWIVTGKVKDE